MIRNFFITSVGRKQSMALSGVLLALFLLIHAIGNSTVFWGWQQFDKYAEGLHSFGVLVDVFELCLLSVFLLHIGTATVLWYKNKLSRPEQYQVKTPHSSLASRTMIYSGFFILIFVCYHLAIFHFNKSGIPASQMVENSLSQPWVAIFYLLSMAVLFFHLNHGLWSFMQSFGANHPRYNSMIIAVKNTIVAVLVAVFVTIPVWIQLG